MTALFCGLTKSCCRVPTVHLSKRNRGTWELTYKPPKITKPIPRHHRRRVFDEIVKAQRPFKPYHDAEHCEMRTVVRSFSEKKNLELNLPERAYARHIIEKFTSKYPIVAVVHALPMDDRQKRMMCGRMALDGIYYAEGENKIMQNVFEFTKYDKLVPLIVGNAGFIFSEQLNVKTFKNHLRKNPNLILLAIGADDRILSVEEFDTLAATPNLENIVVQVVPTVASVFHRTCSVIGSPLHQLTGCLSAHVENLRKNNPD